MARHAAGPAPRSKLRASVARTVVGRSIILGVAPAIVLGGALAPTATAETLAPTLEPEGTSAPAAPEDSALPNSGTTEAEVKRVAVEAAPVAEADMVDDVTGSDAETGAEAATVADGAVVLDTADTEGRLAGEIAVPAGFQTVGLSWPAEIDDIVPEMQVRTRAANGTWSTWSHLERFTDDADAGSAVKTSAPVYVGEADAVQLATVDEAAEFPEGMELSLVSSAQVTSSAATTSGAVASTTATGGPTIITREEWGAAPRCLEPGTGPSWFPAEGGLKAAAIHHTVNPNDYSTVAEAMQAIRNDQAYHQNTHGWCDIGYNFLVDKWGNIYEGADGSIEEPIIGAHTGGFNTGTVGVAMVGTYTDVAPSTAQKTGVAKIAGYKLSLYGLNPSESVTLTSAGLTSGGRYDEGEQVVLPRVFGHRDTHRTECPGDLGYAQLASIRSAAAKYAVEYTPAAEKYVNFVQAVYQDSLGREATAAEVDGWDNRVAAYGQGVLADAMATSSKYRTARIVSAFQTALGVPPTSTQLSGHLTAVADGTRTIDEVMPVLLRSAKYYERAGGTDRAYITALYQEILHREPSESQLDAWTAQLASKGRSSVVNSLWRNPGAVRVRVLATYAHYLDETPSSSTTTGWVDRMTSGSSNEATLRRALLVTERYLTKADARY